MIKIDWFKVWMSIILIVGFYGCVLLILFLMGSFR
jgi:hypothetical protein